MTNPITTLVRLLPAVTLAAALAVLGAAGPTTAENVPPRLADLAFMTGHWVADWNGNLLEEQFMAPRHGTMIGMFRWMSDDRTSFSEHMTIEQRDDGVHFFLRHFNPGIVPWEQEKDGAMHFRLTEADEGRAVFTDPQTDFPSTITYHRTRPDTMVVTLSGHGDDGAPREMAFTFRSSSMTTSTQTLTAAGQSLGYDGGLTLSFHVKDLKKSLDWYQNVVGFKLQYHMEEMGWCELTSSVPGVNIGLSQVEDVKIGGPVPTFGVKDIDHARRKLESQGVRFDGPTQEIPEMVKLATFYDPDGNALMLYQTLSEMGGTS